MTGRDEFWKQLRDEIGGDEVEDERLLELVEALEAEGVPRDRARLAVLAAFGDGRSAMAQDMGKWTVSAARRLIERAFGGSGRGLRR